MTEAPGLTRKGQLAQTFPAVGTSRRRCKQTATPCVLPWGGRYSILAVSGAVHVLQRIILAKYSRVLYVVSNAELSLSLQHSFGLNAPLSMRVRSAMQTGKTATLRHWIGARHRPNSTFRIKTPTHAAMRSVRDIGAMESLLYVRMASSFALPQGEKAKGATRNVYLYRNGQ